jgi:hypothetical protein
MCNSGGTLEAAMKFRAFAILAVLATAVPGVAGCSENKNLTVTGVEPKNGKFMGGDRVHIEGSGFTNQGFTVYFGKKKASNCMVESPARLLCDTPAGVKGEVVDVLVQFDDSREATIKQAFTFIDPIGEGGTGWNVEGKPKTP